MSSDILNELLRAIRDARARGFHLNDEILLRELASLADPRQAEALIHYWLDDKTQVETAEAMGITQPAVHRLLKAGAAGLAARIVLLAVEQGKARQP